MIAFFHCWFAEDFKEIMSLFLQFFFYCPAFFLFTAIQAEEIRNPIDLDTCINERTQQYPLDGYSGVCLVSPLRTGSTLVYNILRILFENLNSSALVRKTHDLNHLATTNPAANHLYVFTLRDPADSCFSWYRVMNEKNGKELTPLTQNYIQDIVIGIVHQWNLLHQLQALNKEVIVLKYEDFVNNPDHIFKTLEDRLSISINDADKNLLIKALSKENVLDNINSIDSFDKWSKIHLFHGNHIDQSEIPDEIREGIKNMIREEILNFKDIFNQWGYTTI